MARLNTPEGILKPNGREALVVVDSDAASTRKCGWVGWSVQRAYGPLQVPVGGAGNRGSACRHLGSMDRDGVVDNLPDDDSEIIRAERTYELGLAAL